MALDLGKPEGRAVLLRLLDGADVLIENFKPGSMEKWGLGYGDAVAALPRPRSIAASPASAPTGRSAGCRATTPSCRR